MVRPRRFLIPYFRTLDYPDQVPSVICKECGQHHVIVEMKKAVDLPMASFIVECPRTQRKRRYTPTEAIWAYPAAPSVNHFDL